ncbi:MULTISPECIES: helix-turn-helix transcriptional regulator [Enterobacter]|jgi:AraC-like DNA-binding protein|uniref:helix-turn-helix transcriptional regulator n=1 Tax=Enterobacter TaxID=547 RepID=UPI000451045B|nr:MULTISPECIES: AraC family transcriptional regulator [Enterobacter]EUM16464.1 AraC family transcriptional regulator [Enterobacter sp. BIDMC 29]KLQ31245.1 AraC family transcriptional regulator [Enterobacter bugandensis]MBD0814020.1 helix-turn-helix domain-containing protein [Enterobacter sp. E12]MBE3492186.1 helix-turn-helix domain-containing protein [Enterobacter cloacae complex sp. P12RS]MBE4809926.1 helix-turn-helix domain-containing protein [Enterobacter cloacae complex sp. P44RS]
MHDAPITDRLELITLNDTVASFSRLFANTVRYHHWHQCLEILYVEEGFGVAIVDNRHYTMRPGRLFFFPPFTLHKVRVDEQAEAIYRRTIIHLDHHAVLKCLRDFPHTQQRLEKLSRRGSEAWVVDLAHCHSHVDHLFSCYPPPMSSESIAGLLISLFAMLPDDRTGAPGSSTGIASQVMFWLDEHYQEKFRLDALAAELGRSRSYVSRKFHAETGEKIHHYLNTLRLRKACECLLHSDASVREIAARVGFSDVTWFISAFKKGIGETPLQYRKNHRAV